MNLSESLRVALDSLFINKMRAVLTTLGIVIGVGAVVSLVTLGRGVQRYVTAQFEGLGANLITVTSIRPSADPDARINPLTDAEAADLDNPRIAPSVEQVTATYSVSGRLVAGTESLAVTVEGVMPNYTILNNWNVGSGRFVNQDDLEKRARVVVLGLTAVEELYGDRRFNPIGLSLNINGRIFTVVGVMEEQTSSVGADPNETAFVPITTAQRRLDNARVRGGAYEVSQIQVQVASQDQIDTAAEEITAYFMKAHDIQYTGYEDFSIFNQSDILDSINQITGLLTVFLSVVAGISLLVGGIGIMNIMLVTVTERTREIGLRKAVGARGTDILSQFLIESLMLSLLGGLLGVGLSWLLTSIGGALIPDLPLVITGDAIALATGVCTFIGVFFGIYPASHAARMRPIDALRFE